jgi:hypothetical protein
MLYINLSLPTSYFDPGLDMNRLPTNPSKTISPPGKLEGNIAHRVYCAVSPEIVLWVTTMLKFLQCGNEWGSGIVFCDLHLFHLLPIYIKHPVIIYSCM